MAERYQYRAFISYSHADEAWGKWLHQKLERYRVPSRLVGSAAAHGEVPSRIGRCFRDQEELSVASRLGETLKQALRDSEVLIVICSPRAATSHWVNEEIMFFKSLGRDQSIYALTIDGEPNSNDPARECFPQALRDSEPLAADARESADGRSDAFLKLAAGILGVGFDQLRQRERTRRRRLVTAVIAASLGIAAVTSILAVAAYRARDEAQVRREQADDLVGYMLGDLKDRLEKVGRLDVLDSTVSKAMGYLDLGTSDLAAADAATLAQRSRARSNVTDIRYARGQIDEAIVSGQQAEAAARALQQIQPGDEADEILARALRALGEPSMEKGVDAASLARAEEGRLIASRLNAKAPRDAGRALLLAQADDQLGYGSAYKAKPDLPKATQLWQECIDVLRPYLDADSKYLTFKMRCQLQTASANGTFGTSRTTLEQWVQFARDAGDAARRHPRDLALANMLLAGLSSATVMLGGAERISEARLASATAVELGRRLTTFDPENTFWGRFLALALNTSLFVEIQAEDWAASRRFADEGYAACEIYRKKDPDNVNLRTECMRHLIRRAELAHATGDGEMQQRELDAAKALFSSEDSHGRILDNVVLLYRLQWLWRTVSDPAADAADLSMTEKLRSRIPDSFPSAEEDDLYLAYMQLDIEDGERRRALISSRASASSNNQYLKFRDAACARKPSACRAVLRRANEPVIQGTAPNSTP